MVYTTPVMAALPSGKAKPRKILLLQPSYIGDVVFASPLVKAIKRRYPDSRISLLVDARSREVARYIPGVDEILSFDRQRADRGLTGLLQTAGRIRRGGYDLLLAPHRAARTSLLALFSGVPLRVGYGGVLGRLAYHLRAQRQKDEPCELAQDAGLLKLLGIELDDTRLSLHRPRGLDAYLESFFYTNGLKQSDRLAALCPGAIIESKRWPAVYFASLAEMLKLRGLKPVLFGGPAESRLALEIMGACREKIYSCIGNRLEEAAALLGRCEVCVGGDSGLTHMARALGLPTVIIFGPTDPRAHRFEEHTRVLTASLPCRPCSRKGGPKRCPYGHHDCMRLVSPEQVIKAVRQLVNLKTPPPPAEPVGQPGK